jgi:KaiC/GvpD/RAD55 family RecA-like ATPase
VADETPRYAIAKLASQVKRERVDWLQGMEGRVPRRSVTMLVGDPGLGKSMFSLLMAARVGQAGGFALVATAEDSPAAVVRPAAGRAASRPGAGGVRGVVAGRQPGGGPPHP